MNLDKVFQNIKLIKSSYEKNDNIISLINGLYESQKNTPESILTSYDLQAGSYIAGVKRTPDYYQKYTSEISETISNYIGGLQGFRLMEVGVGELTTLTAVASQINHVEHVLGFDISLSRISVGREFFKQNCLKELRTSFFVADIFHIPLADSSVDVVYTSHSIEPNGGREFEALNELIRVSSQWIFLFEPSYENNSPEGKGRMDRLGYIKGLNQIIEKMDVELVDTFGLKNVANPLNPTWCHVLKKKSVTKSKFYFQCPYTNKRLEEMSDTLLADDGLSYPKVFAVPYLLRSHAILATKLGSE